MNPESSVQERYATAAKESEPALCCPVDYDPGHLDAIPAEVIEKDYGCGNPSRHLKAGETVLDLGSGTGKICFIASQVVGPQGRVIGIDMTEDMLEVARRNAPVVAERIGYGNVEFRKGRIQDLALDLELLDRELAAQPVGGVDAWMRMEGVVDRLRRESPLVEAGSVDVVVSNCVLNLVDARSKPQLFDEIFRVLKRGGRAVISDIVSDEPVPEAMQRDARLWSGCISGALTEEGFLQAFEAAGFHGIEILEFETQPWQTVAGIEFRSVTVQAWKGKDGPCLDHNQAVIYKGPFREVVDDDGHRLRRGRRQAVCGKTFALYQGPAYRDAFEAIEPRQAVTPEDAPEFDRHPMARRPPRETKGREYDLTTDPSQSGGDGGCC
ncbi:MAG: methyltransferase domain-containing protein [Akkermansiaceae bacterium]|nr:methyltransferase domain-containing protein [Akkermansiaceae bacterium]